MKQTAYFNVSIPKMWGVLGKWENYDAVALWHHPDDSHHDAPYRWAISIPSNPMYGSIVTGPILHRNHQGGWIDVGLVRPGLWPHCPKNLPLGHVVTLRVVQEAYTWGSEEKPVRLHEFHNKHNLSSPLFTIHPDQNPDYIERFLTLMGQDLITQGSLSTADHETWSYWHGRLPQWSVTYDPSVKDLCHSIDEWMHPFFVVHDGLNLFWERTHMGTCVDVNFDGEKDEKKIWNDILEVFLCQFFGRRLGGMIYIDGPRLEKKDQGRILNLWRQSLKKLSPRSQVSWTPAGVMEITLPRRWCPL